MIFYSVITIEVPQPRKHICGGSVNCCRRLTPYDRIILQKLRETLDRKIKYILAALNGFVVLFGGRGHLIEVLVLG